MQGKILIQKSEKVKIIKIVLGASILVFSGYRFFNITNPSPFFVTYPGIVVLLIGVITILMGVLNKGDSKITRTIEVGIGITAIVIALFIFVVFHDDITSRSSWLLFIFIIIQGVRFIATGIIDRSKVKAIRISKIMIGIMLITLIGLLYPDVPIIMISGLLSTNILLIGIEIISGAVGNKIAKSS